MKLSKRHVLPFLAACGVSLAMTSVGLAQDKVRTIFGTGNSGGVYYILGAGMGDIINKNSKILDVTAQSTSGTTENLNLVNTGEFGFGFTVYDSAYFAYIAGREYEGKPKMENIRILMMGHVGMHASVVWADSSYKSLGDFKGMKVPTSPGVAAYLLDYATYKPWGIELPKGKTPILSYTDQTTALKDGNIPVGNYNMAHPASTILDLASSKPVRLLGQTEESMAAILKEHPYWIKAVIPKGTYNGQEQDVITIGFPYAIVVNKDMPDAAVREFLKLCFENDLKAIHPDGRYYSLSNKDYPAEPLVPYHPAAKKYLQEVGLLK
jgi:TRAP transporter TAXI family solute receptor